MSVRQVFQTAISNLRANRLRCLQAMLVFVIGVAAAVASLDISNILLGRLNNIAADYSPNSMHVMVARRVNYSTSFKPEDMVNLADEHSELINAVSPCLSEPSSVKYGDRVFEQFECQGVSENLTEIITAFKVEQGRFLQHMDIVRRQNVCVLGSYAAQEIMDGDALGRKIRIGGEEYTVVGVLKEIDKYKSEGESNFSIFIPYTKCTEEFLPNHLGQGQDTYYSGYFVKAASEETVTDASRAIAAMLKDSLGDARVTYFTNLEDAMTQRKTSIYLITAFILAGSFVVLLLGGTGISNMMMMLVTKRTKEIGIRKAFGATCKDIRQQFMLESVITASMGGIIGVLLGKVVCLVILCFITEIPVDKDSISIAANWQSMIFNISPAFLTLGFTMLVGITSGTQPANMAAKLEIVDAINSD